jgi:hypothetical protein
MSGPSARALGLACLDRPQRLFEVKELIGELINVLDLVV